MSLLLESGDALLIESADLLLLEDDASILDAAGAVYAYSGGAVGLTVGRRLEAAGAAYTYSGGMVDMTYTAATGNGILLESGDTLLLESGDAHLLEWSQYSLSSPVVASQTAGVTFDFDPNATGTIYYVVGPAIGWYDPSSAEIEAGQLFGGATATFADSETAPADSGAWTAATAITGLTGGVEYRAAFAYVLSGEYSNVVTTGTFSTAYSLTATGGTFSYSGGDATLTYTPNSGDDYTLTASGGTFSYSGGDASFLRTYVLSAESGSFSLAGGDATFTYSGAPVVEPPKQTGGGKSRKPRKRRYQVEIDGEVHEVESLQEAEAVLAEVAQKATETAKLAIERAAKAKRRPVRKIVRDAEKALEVPAVSVPSSLQSYADQMIGKIRAEYQSALSAIEIAAHMAKREREIEEDDEDVLMLL